MAPSEVYEVIDNDEYGRHGDALRSLAAHYDGPLSVATAYVGLEGLDALVTAADTQQKSAKLLIGAAPAESVTSPDFPRPAASSLSASAHSSRPSTHRSAATRSVSSTARPTRLAHSTMTAV